MPVMTASESLTFTSYLVLPPRLSRRVRARRVADVLEVVGLLTCANTMVRAVELNAFLPLSLFFFLSCTPSRGAVGMCLQDGW